MSTHTMKVVDRSHVAPPPGSVSTTTIPLTFLDVAWLFCCPIQRISFYELPYPTVHITETIIPRLIQSLSLTLRHFFPLAAKLVCPPPPSKPFILYSKGDSVPFTVAESDADFNHLVSNYARDNRSFQCLVPELPTASVSLDGTHILPIMDVQVTVFPNSGISIGVTFNHVAADGRSFNHFMKSWATIHRSGGNFTSILLPYHNKDAIKDTGGLSSILLKDWWSWEKSEPLEIVPENNVRVTLVLSRAQIEKLKQWVKTLIIKDNEPGPLHVSSFVVTCAFMWVYLSKFLESTGTSSHLQDDMLYHFILVADCRERFGLEIPAAYFGNCLAHLFLSAKRSELMGKNGIVVAAKAIGRKICEVEKGPFIGAEKWMSNSKELVKLPGPGRLVTVAGSPRLRVYETDFGWGRLKKSELAHIGAYGSFSINEYRDEEGGVEIGSVVPRDKLDFFNALFALPSVEYSING